MSVKNDIQSLILREWRTTNLEDPRVRVAAKAIAAKFGDAHLATFFYGSVLNTGVVADNVLDFYIVVDRYDRAYEGLWLPLANRMIPPNVFYYEDNVDGVTVRAKYAVISRADFAFRCTKKSLNSAIWARFSQPCYPVLMNESEREDFAHVVADAAITMVGEAAKLFPYGATAREGWVKALEMTYSAEYRSERDSKALELYVVHSERYKKLWDIVLQYLKITPKPKPSKQPASSALTGPRFKWFLRRLNGRFISVLRLLKASTTFRGGIDYLAWKIKRHSGVQIEVTPWMRRHQLLGGIKAWWSVRGKGAIR